MKEAESCSDAGSPLTWDCCWFRCAFLITSPTLCPNFENSYVPHVQLSRSEETWQILDTLRYPAKNSVVSSFAGAFSLQHSFFTSIDQPIYSTFTQSHGKSAPSQSSALDFGSHYTPETEVRPRETSRRRSIASYVIFVWDIGTEQVYIYIYTYTYI